MNFVPRFANDRGHVHMGWLDTWHTFSFGNYYDPLHMGSSALRVINDDRIAPRNGFGMHGHRNMEILTVMLEGTLTHRDSMRNEATITAGEYQLMSAGRGVMHSEYNESDTPVHLLQIWLEPNIHNTEPGYRQRMFERTEGFNLIASPDGASDSFRILQDARIWRVLLPSGSSHALPLTQARTGWLHMIGGEVVCNGVTLGPADAMQLTEANRPDITVAKDADFLFFDLP